MYRENNPQVIRWIEEFTASADPCVRANAAGVCAAVEFEGRAAVVEHLQADADPRVRAAAQSAALVCAEEVVELDLFESDFMDGGQAPDLAWEWEYRVLVCTEQWIPDVPRLVWLNHEDDAAARSLACMDASAAIQGKTQGNRGLIIDKRAVNRFTRSPRNHFEAMRWRAHGRPPYEASDEGPRF